LLQEEVKSVVISLNQINLDLFLAKNQTILVNNNSKINDWEKLTNIETVLPKITDNKVKLDDLLESLTKELEFKNNNILEPVKTETIDKFLSIIEELNKSIENYNEKLTDFNAKIVSYKITLEKENISVIENQLKIANLQKIRQSPIAESLCNKYKEQKRLIDGLKVKDKQNQEKLDKENLDNISKYADNINKYLQYFAPYLTIENLHTEFYAASRVPFLEYGLFVSNTKVKFEDKSNKYHSFKYTLSEGDKSALALSFFFAKLATNINLEEKVIIFDDPIASFDENRRQQTIERLHALSKRVKQLIVLTHDKTFAFDFWNKSKDILPLTISFANNSAFIKEYDIEHETSMGLIKDMKTLRGIFSQDAKNDSE
jgi:wobble nucleotide-excising tRNase